MNDSFNFNVCTLEVINTWNLFCTCVYCVLYPFNLTIFVKLFVSFKTKLLQIKGLFYKIIKALFVFRIYKRSLIDVNLTYHCRLWLYWYFHALGFFILWGTKRKYFRNWTYNIELYVFKLKYIFKWTKYIIKSSVVLYKAISDTCLLFPQARSNGCCMSGYLKTYMYTLRTPT